MIRTIGAGNTPNTRHDGGNGHRGGGGGDGSPFGIRSGRDRGDASGGGGRSSSTPFPTNGAARTSENHSPAPGRPRTPRRSLAYGVRFSLPPDAKVEDTDCSGPPSPIVPTQLQTSTPTGIQRSEPTRRTEPSKSLEKLKETQTLTAPRPRRASEPEMSDSSTDVFYSATEICHAVEKPSKRETPARRTTVAAGARDDASLVSVPLSDLDDTSSFCSSWATSVASACSDDSHSSGSTVMLQPPIRPSSPTHSVAGSIVSILPLQSESHTSPFGYAAGRRTVLFEEMLLHAQSCVKNRQVQAQLEVCKVKFAYYNGCKERGRMTAERIVAGREKYFDKVRSLARREGGPELQRHLDGLVEQFASVNL